MRLGVVGLLVVTITQCAGVRLGQRNLPLFPTREDIVYYLESEGFKTAIELGVQRGEFAVHNLLHWPTCQEYSLVDIWRSQENYTDGANVEDEEQEARYQQAQQGLAQWSNKTVFLRMLTTEAAPLFADESIDFVYADARHDYCGLKQDLQLYWPKLRPGGILAGHDFLTQAQVSKYIKSDWSLCANGEMHQGAVKAAVEEFAFRHRLHVSVTYWREDWPSWLITKPIRRSKDLLHPLSMPFNSTDARNRSQQFSR